MNTIDARTFEPHAMAHGAILGALEAMPAGVSLTVIAPKLPVPLFDEVEAHFPDTFEHTLVSEAEREFHIEFRRK